MTLGCPRDLFRFGWALLVAAGLGCGAQDSAPSSVPEQAATAVSPGDSGQPGGVNAATPQSGTGMLSGRILFDGEQIPPQTPIPIQTDPQVCEKHGHGGYFPAEDYVIDPQTRGIRYVIVSLKGDAVRKWKDTPRKDFVLDNRNCRFEPHVALSTVGSTIEVKNSDDVYHTTHLYGPGGFQFNPGLRTKGESEKTPLTRPGMYIVKCDRHGWMSAVIRVDDHPFHAVTDEQGRYEIKGIPPGKHQVEVYHEKFGERPIPPEVLEVTIEADQTATLDLKLSH
jgi:plastocyanin